MSDIFAAAGLFKDGNRIVTREEVIVEASIGVLESLIETLRSFNPPQVRSSQQFADWLDLLKGDYESMARALKDDATTLADLADSPGGAQ